VNGRIRRRPGAGDLRSDVGADLAHVSPAYWRWDAMHRIHNSIMGNLADVTPSLAVLLLFRCRVLPGRRLALPASAVKNGGT